MNHFTDPVTGKAYPAANSYVKIEYPEVYSESGVAWDTVRYDNFVRLLFKADTLERMIHHATLGVMTEAGEIADIIKKHMNYNKPFDKKHLIEELGDLRFYIQALQNIYDISEQEVLQHNADKLSTRYYGLQYSDEAAQARADKKPGEE